MLPEAEALPVLWRAMKRLRGVCSTSRSWNQRSRMRATRRVFRRGRTTWREVGPFSACRGHVHGIGHSAGVGNISCVAIGSYLDRTSTKRLAVLLMQSLVAMTGRSLRCCSRSSFCRLPSSWASPSRPATWTRSARATSASERQMHALRCPKIAAGGRDMQCVRRACACAAMFIGFIDAEHQVLYRHGEECACMCVRERLWLVSPFYGKELYSDDTMLCSGLKARA